jgi:predicted RNase H-like nuclease
LADWKKRAISVDLLTRGKIQRPSVAVAEDLDITIVAYAGVDCTPGGWAVVISDLDQTSVQKVTALSDLFDSRSDLKVVAVDVPIGLLEHYEKGGRACDRMARKFLGKRRGSSVFPAPVRSTLAAKSWDEACSLSRASAPQGRGLSKQTFAILPKIKEVDALLQTHLKLRDVVREVHPEVCFAVPRRGAGLVVRFNFILSAAVGFVTALMLN